MNDRLRSTVLVRYESGTDGIYWDRNEKHDADPLPYACMYTFENDAIFNTDVTIEYDLIKTANSTLTVQLDALNLFDHESENEILKMPRMDTRTTSMGRQFFLGMTYTY